MQTRITFDTLIKLWRILVPNERNSAIFLLILIIIGMFFEMLGVGIVVPVMTAIMNPEVLINYPGGSSLQELIGVYGQSGIIITVLIAMSILYVCKTAFLAYLSLKQADFTYGLLSSVSGRLFESYLSQPYEFHLINNSAKLVRNAVTETQVFSLYVISPAISLLAELLVLVGITLLLLYIEPIGSLVAMITVCFVAFAFYALSKKWSAQFGNLRQHHEALRIKLLQEGLRTVKEVILLGRTENFIKLYNKHAKISATSAGRQAVIGQLPRLFLELIIILGLAVLVAVHIYQGHGVNDILPVLVLFAAAAFRLMPSVNRILIAMNSLQYGMPVLNVLYNELLSAKEQKRNKAIHYLDDTPVAQVELRNISYKYSGRHESVLTDINLKINFGEMVGVVGSSGAGKSTLVDLFLGLLSPASGSILVNGNNVDIHSKAWKSRIGYVPQNIVLVDDSIRRNVAFGLEDADIDEVKVVSAIKAAQLESFVSSISEGLDTLVGEHGIRLSGGQRQRIGLARALYSNPDILVLDEATSALDVQTESDVMSAIRSMHGKKTILIVAHRLSTVEECDRVVRLDQGRIIQIGSAQDVINSYEASKDNNGN